MDFQANHWFIFHVRDYSIPCAAWKRRLTCANRYARIAAIASEILGARKGFLRIKGKNILASIGCSSLSVLIGAVIAPLLALTLLGPATVEWYNHNSALNNGEWVMYVRVITAVFVLLVIVITGVLGAVISGIVVFIASLILSRKKL